MRQQTTFCQKHEKIHIDPEASLKEIPAKIIVVLSMFGLQNLGDTPVSRRKIIANFVDWASNWTVRLIFEIFPKQPKIRVHPFTVEKKIPVN